jgi:hypothetical protein
MPGFLLCEEVQAMRSNRVSLVRGMAVAVLIAASGIAMAVARQPSGGDDDTTRRGRGVARAAGGEPKGGDPRPTKPLAFKDSMTGILIYAESDGRHVAGIDRDGKILWHRNPFEDAKLEPYRTRRPVVSFIGHAHESTLRTMKSRGKQGPFVGLSFNSTQSGLLDVKTGDFFFIGQD